MEPLFANQFAYDDFTKRHNAHHVKTADISTYEGNCYLGIDAGSTTTKAALVDEDGNLLYSFYSSNNGSPLDTSIKAVKTFIQSFHLRLRLCRPVQQVMVRLLSSQHLCLMKVKLKLCPTSMLLHSLTLRLTVL